jgi:hypothetical protein
MLKYKEIKIRIKKLMTQRIYQVRWSSERLKIEVIHANPVFGDVEFLSVCPVVNRSRHFRISGMCKNKDVVVMDVGVCKCKEILKVCGRTFVPYMNIRRWSRDARHTEVLMHIYRK